MKILLEIQTPVILKTFNSLSPEQMGRTLKRFLGCEEVKLLTQDEVDVYKELIKQQNNRKADYRKRVEKQWETKRKNKIEIEKKLQQLERQNCSQQWQKDNWQKNKDPKVNPATQWSYI